jgi:hypothetical protein
MLIKYITLRWIWFWDILTLILALLTQNTQNTSIFWATIISAVILVVSTLLVIGKSLKKRNDIKQICVCYLIPKKQYPGEVRFDGATEYERYPHKLTVGTGQYTLFIQVYSKIDIMVDPIRVIFSGPDTNKPRIVGKHNPFIRERLKDGSYRNWWNDIEKPAVGYPRPFYHQDCLMETNMICTYGKWEGKIHVEIPIRGTGKLERDLNFSVSTNVIDDNVPFLKDIKGQVYGFYVPGSTTNARLDIK